MKKLLLDQVKKFPNSPGVYIFQGERGKVLYIGKAGSLINRVRSYFINSGSKINSLLEETKKINYVKTDSVLEALILEANLIKKYWPLYNVREKDNRSFIYIVIPNFKVEDFPYPIIVRGHELKKYPPSNFYIFGPYQSWAITKKALFLIRKIFPYCTTPNTLRPCFYYQIGLCPGACIGKISKEDYQKIIKNLILFLDGKKKRVIENLKKTYPEKMKVLTQLQDSALISREEIRNNFLTDKFRIEGYDISHFAGKGTYGSMVVFENNQPVKRKYRLFKIKSGKPKDDIGALKEVIQRRLAHKEWKYPDLFLIDGGKGQVNCVYSILKKSHIAIPVIGVVKGKENKDKLIFKGTSKNIKRMFVFSRPLLQRIRDEAHRFAIKFSRKSYSIKNKTYPHP